MKDGEDAIHAVGAGFAGERRFENGARVKSVDAGTGSRAAIEQELNVRDGRREGVSAVDVG